MDLNHPLVRSALLPFALALLGSGALRGLTGATAGRRWALAALGAALLASAGWTLGWRIGPTSFAEKLPWVLAAAWLAGLGLEGARAGAGVQWGASAALWALALLWFGGPSWAGGLASWVVGTAAAGALLHAPREGAQAPAMLLVAGGGLALVAMQSGSALLFELALALCAALAGCALWLWPKARAVFGASAAVVALLAWLALAQGTLLLTRAPAGALLLLAAALASGVMLRLLRRRRAFQRAWVEPLLLAAVAAPWAVAAVALTAWLALRIGGADDAYYTPNW